MLLWLMAWIEDRLSVKMMICLVLFDVKWPHAYVIAVSSALCIGLIARAVPAPRAKRKIQRIVDVRRPSSSA